MGQSTRLHALESLAQLHPVIALIGPSLVGKTTVARKLARRLGREAVDSDACIADTYGPLEVIFARQGEVFFRKIEAEVVAAILRRHGPVVISLGAGAPLHPQTARHLSVATTVVYLEAEEGTIVQRFAGAASRPLLQNGGSDGEALLARWRQLHRGRREHYRKLANVTVWVDPRSAQNTADRVLDSLDAVPAPGKAGGECR